MQVWKEGFCGGTAQLRQRIGEGFLDDWFAAAYLADQTAVLALRNRYINAIDGFEATYGAADEVHLFSAPGRTEVGGNHTDHNRGKVLAAAVNLDTIGVVAKRQDQLVQVCSQGFGSCAVCLDETAPVATEKNTTPSLVRGVAAGFLNHGLQVGGFDAYLQSTVKEGSGLSSSAAFEMLMAWVFAGLYNPAPISPVLLAQIGQYAENVYFGKASGLLDQLTSAVGGFITADFADPVNPQVCSVPFEEALTGVDLVIVDTGGSHADLSDAYSDIPKEMKQVAAALGCDCLAQVSEDAFLSQLGALRHSLGDRCLLRALHFFAENNRVEAEAAALQAGDFETFARLVVASGRSSYEYLQNVFCTFAPQTQPIGLGLCLAEKYLAPCGGAWRVHGGGFAGTMQAFVPKAHTQGFCAAMEAVFGAGKCYLLGVRPFGGMMLV